MQVWDCRSPEALRTHSPFPTAVLKGIRDINFIIGEKQQLPDPSFGSRNPCRIYGMKMVHAACSGGG